MFINVDRLNKNSNEVELIKKTDTIKAENDKDAYSQASNEFLADVTISEGFYKNVTPRSFKIVDNKQIDLREKLPKKFIDSVDNAFDFVLAGMNKKDENDTSN